MWSSHMWFFTLSFRNAVPLRNLCFKACVFLLVPFIINEKKPQIAAFSKMYCMYCFLYVYKKTAKHVTDWFSMFYSL